MKMHLILFNRVMLSDYFVKPRVKIVLKVVFKAGEIVERGLVEQVFEQPQDPYTIELLAANPTADPEL